MSVRIDQLGPVMDVPVTVSVVYASGATDDHLVKLSQGSTFVQLPASGPVRGVELNRDEQALIVVERGAAPRTPDRRSDEQQPGRPAAQAVELRRSPHAGAAAASTR